MASPIHVVVGVILAEDGRILLTRRPEHLHMGGRWEFPGGKIEIGESAEQALIRELEEEVGLLVSTPSKLIQVEYDYGDKLVRLDSWLVNKFSGTANGLEGQSLIWAKVAELKNYQFPDANQVIVEVVQAHFKKVELF